MSDLLLTHAYFLEEDEKERQIMKPYPTLGLLCLSAFLKGAASPWRFTTTFSSRERLWSRLESWGGTGPRYLHQPDDASEHAGDHPAPRRSAVVVLGGPERKLSGVLAAAANVSSGEEGAAGFFLPSPHGFRLHGVAGPCSGTRRAPCHEPRGPSSRPRRSWPDRRPWTSAPTSTSERTTVRGVNLITARAALQMRLVLALSSASRTFSLTPNVAAEVAYLAALPADQLWYADDVFTLHGWLFQYAAALKRRGSDPLRVDLARRRMMKEEVLETLAEMGCTRIWIGSRAAASGSSTR
jgi:hypothetical protein